MKRILLPLLLLAWAGTAHAIQWEARRCESCNEAQRQAIVTPGGPGERFAYSLSQNVIKRYMIEWYTEGRSSGYWLVYELPMDSDVQAAFNEIRTHWSQNGGLNFYHEYVVGGAIASSTPPQKNASSTISQKNSVQDGPEPLDLSIYSAYDALEHANHMQSLGIAISDSKENTLLGRLIGDNFNVNFSAGKWVSFGLNGEVNSFALVMFVDGSRLEMMWKKDPAPGEYVFKPGSAYDAENQNIVDNSHLQAACPLCGQYFSWNDPANANRWAIRTTLFGIPTTASPDIVCGRVNGGPPQCTPVP